MLQQQRFGAVALRSGVGPIDEMGEVIAAGQDDQRRVGCGEPSGRVGQRVGHRQRNQAERFEQQRPALVERVTALVAIGKDLHPLTNDGPLRADAHPRISIVRLEQSRLTTVAEASALKRVSPTPIAAGSPSSAARTAMCELAPPYIVIRPAMLRASIQS
ncbi:unannotated protein [freshwater metagenome]|uniref:Unannotated protein n=1 Tax=freshwater metagenome TaxID=449393 RepID=A0A6J5ZXE6_9ZZZZ